MATKFMTGSAAAATKQKMTEQDAKLGAPRTSISSAKNMTCDVTVAAPRASAPGPGAQTVTLQGNEPCNRAHDAHGTNSGGDTNILSHGGR